LGRRLGAEDDEDEGPNRRSSQGAEAADELDGDYGEYDQQDEEGEEEDESDELGGEEEEEGEGETEGDGEAEEFTEGQFDEDQATQTDDDPDDLDFQKQLDLLISENREQRKSDTSLQPSSSSLSIGALLKSPPNSPSSDFRLLNSSVQNKEPKNQSLRAWSRQMAKEARPRR